MQRECLSRDYAFLRVHVFRLIKDPTGFISNKNLNISEFNVTFTP